MSKNEEIKRKKKKIDKSQIAIKVMAFILALCMIIPVAISAIYAIKG